MATARQSKSPRKTTRKDARGTSQAKGSRHDADRRSGVPIPLLTPQVKVFHVPAPPAVGAVAEAGRSVASHLPPRDQLVFYGGLGAMAAFNVISWPVAAAIGVGTAIARRGLSGRGKSQEGKTSAEPAKTR